MLSVGGWGAASCALLRLGDWARLQAALGEGMDVRDWAAVMVLVEPAEEEEEDDEQHQSHMQTERSSSTSSSTGRPAHCRNSRKQRRRNPCPPASGTRFSLTNKGLCALLAAAFLLAADVHSCATAISAHAIHIYAPMRCSPQ